MQQAFLKQMASAVEESGEHAPPTDKEVASQLCLPLFRRTPARLEYFGTCCAQSGSWIRQEAHANEAAAALPAEVTESAKPSLAATDKDQVCSQLTYSLTASSHQHGM